MGFNIFDLISVLYALAGVSTLVQFIRSWRTFWDEDFTPQEQRLAQSVGFFLIIPIGVLFHEYGHLVATRMVGGRVVEFQWRFFWGYVVPVGHFTPAQDWWIALSGNLISVIFGWVLLAVGYKGRALHRVLRFLLLKTGYFQAMYALVGYPVLSLLGFVGDWIVIYDFRRTPLLSGITAVFHVLLLLGLWRWWNSRPAQELLFDLTTGEGTALAELQRAVEEHPQDVDAYVRLMEAYQERMAWTLVEQTAREALKRGMEHPRLYTGLGHSLLAQGKIEQSVSAFQRSLALGLTGDEADDAWVNLALAHVRAGRHKEALHALERIRGPLTSSFLFYYIRGLAHYGIKERERAIADLRVALAQLPDSSNPAAERITMLLQELEGESP